jgi:hypothetical protein
MNSPMLEGSFAHTAILHKSFLYKNSFKYITCIYFLRILNWNIFIKAWSSACILECLWDLDNINKNCFNCYI